MFTNGENLQDKTPLGDFKITTLENPVLSQQAVTSNGITVPYTNLQLNPYSNTQLDLFCSDNLSFSIHGSQYMTNYQLEKDVGCKVFQFINTIKITKLFGYKTLRCTNVAASSRERSTRAYVSGHNILVKNFCIKSHQLWWPLK